MTISGLGTLNPPRPRASLTPSTLTERAAMDPPAAFLTLSGAPRLGGQDASQIAGAVVGGTWGCYIGGSIGAMAGGFLGGLMGGHAATGAIVGATLIGYYGASKMGAWGNSVGFKSAACVAGLSVAGGILGQMAMGSMGGFLGSVGGAVAGGWLAQKLSKH